MSKAFDIVMSNRQEIVDKLIAQMEKGYASTRAAWSQSATGRPYNPVSNAVYRGGNRFRLMIAAEENGFSDPRWMTFKQAEEKNYQIAAGSKGVLLEKWIFHKDVPKLDENKEPVIGADGKPEMERIKLAKPVVNYFRVFNGEQVIGLPELEKRELTEDYYSKTADIFESSSKCPVLYEQQDEAYYSPTEDKIHLPPKEAFKNNETRLAVLLHEMAHSTGHESRLNRDIKNEFGSIAYAKEELNAELSSVFLENELGIEMNPDSEMLKDHANYVKSWISVLKNDPNELFVACANAEEITEFLMQDYERQLEILYEVSEKDMENNFGDTRDWTFQYDTWKDVRKSFENSRVFEEKEVTDKINELLKTWDEKNIQEYIDTHANEIKVIGYDEMVHAAGAKQLQLKLEQSLDPVAPDATVVKAEKVVEDKEITSEQQGILDDILQNRSVQDRLDFTNKEFIEVRFSGDLKGVDFSKSRFINCSFENAHLSGNKMNGTSFHDCKFSYGCMESVDLSGASFYGIQFEHHEMSNNNLERVYLADSVFKHDCIINDNNFLLATISKTQFWNEEKHWQEHMSTVDIRCGGATTEEYERYRKEVVEHLTETDVHAEPRIRQELKTHGFKPTKALVENIKLLEKAEMSKLSLKDIAQFSKIKNCFGDNPIKQGYLTKIASECKSQELDKVQETLRNDSFLKQEVMMEQMMQMQ